MPNENANGAVKQFTLSVYYSYFYRYYPGMRRRWGFGFEHAHCMYAFSNFRLALCFPFRFPFFFFFSLFLLFLSFFFLFFFPFFLRKGDFNGNVCAISVLLPTAMARNGVYSRNFFLGTLPRYLSCRAFNAFNKKKAEKPASWGEGRGNLRECKFDDGMRYR